MKKLLGIVAAVAMYLMVIDGFAKTLDRPQVFVNGENGQLIKAIMPDKDGNVITIYDYRDPLYRQILKDGEYDTETR